MLEEPTQDGRGAERQGVTLSAPRRCRGVGEMISLLSEGGVEA
jgi:hypothetical protein